MGFALIQLGAEKCGEIAEGLFTVKKTYGDKLAGLCPFHSDKSASFYYTPVESGKTKADSFGCSVCGVYGDLIKLWSHVHGLDSKTDGFKAFCREHGITGKGPAGTRKREKPPPPPAKPKGVWKRLKR